MHLLSPISYVSLNAVLRSYSNTEQFCAKPQLSRYLSYLNVHCSMDTQQLISQILHCRQNICLNVSVYGTKTSV